MIFSIKGGGNRMIMKDPLSIEDREKVLAVSKTMKKIDRVDPYKVIATFMFTGCHPSVLANRGKSRILVVDNYIQWLRPKKKGSPAFTKILIHKEIKPWIQDFLFSDLPDWREWYWDICRQVGKKAGIPFKSCKKDNCDNCQKVKSGCVSPMTLRHTFGVMLDEMGFTPAEIQSMMNVSLPVLMRYTSRTRKQIEVKLVEKGWV